MNLFIHMKKRDGIVPHAFLHLVPGSPALRYFQAMFAVSFYQFYRHAF